MRIAFLGGGTGGHLAPGVGVAEVLRARGHEVRFHVAGRAVESAVLEPRGFPAVDLFGPGGRPGLGRVGRWFGATRRWRAATAEMQPDAVIILGGWVSLPAVWSGLGSRPSLLIETNARPGRVQRLLGGRVDVTCLAAPGPAMPRGRRATLWTGSPVPALPRRERGEALTRLGLRADRRTLLLMGGSQGAADLNALLPSVCRELVRDGDAWQVLNLTGAAAVGCPELDEAGCCQGVPVTRLPFCADMPSAWAVTDVAVCRSGAGTVAELALAGAPSVLVPYPHHADRHQVANALPLVEAGAATLVGAHDPTGVRSVPSLLHQLLARRERMAAAARRMARPDAALRVADAVEALVRGPQEFAAWLDRLPPGAVIPQARVRTERVALGDGASSATLADSGDGAPLGDVSAPSWSAHEHSGAGRAP